MLPAETEHAGSGWLPCAEAVLGAVQATRTTAILPDFRPHAFQLWRKLRGARGAPRSHAAVVRTHVEADGDCGPAG